MTTAAKAAHVLLTAGGAGATAILAYLVTAWAGLPVSAQGAITAAAGLLGASLYHMLDTYLKLCQARLDRALRQEQAAAPDASLPNALGATPPPPSTMNGVNHS